MLAGKLSSKREPTPLVFIKIPSQAPFGTTFVSPHTTHRPASFATLAREHKIRSKLASSKPSSMIKAQLRYKGFAPIIAMSFILPQAAILPMSPPAKNIGFTTKLSVVKTSFLELKSSKAPSLLWRKISLSKHLKITSFISAFISAPPPPQARDTDFIIIYPIFLVFLVLLL